MEIREKFNAKFRLPQDDFSNLINLRDTEVGFSVYKSRKEKGFKSLFRVYIKNKDLKGSEVLKPIIITASYGKESEDGIVIASSEFKREVNWPIELTSEGEFFYNIETDDLYYKNQTITGIELFQKVDEWHTKPTRFFGGFILRTKLVLLQKWSAYVPIIFIWLLYLVSGDKITKNLWARKAEARSTLDKISKNPQEKESKKLNIFGYEASQWAVTFYFVLHLIGLGIREAYNIKVAFISEIFSNNFLTIAYVIPTLVFIDRGLPKILKYLISKTTDFAVWASYKKVRI